MEERKEGQGQASWLLSHQSSSSLLGSRAVGSCDNLLTSSCPNSTICSKFFKPQTIVGNFPSVDLLAKVIHFFNLKDVKTHSQSYLHTTCLLLMFTHLYALY